MSMAKGLSVTTAVVALCTAGNVITQPLLFMLTATLFS